MAGTDTKKSETPPVYTGDPELDAKLEETLTPGQKRWWRQFVGAKSTGFTFSAEEYLRRSAQEE